MRIIGNLLSISTDADTDQHAALLMSNERFQKFMINVLFSQSIINSDGSSTGNVYKSECLWVLSNILGLHSEANFEIIMSTSGLVERLIHLAGPDSEYHVRKEALIAVYNLCENHNSKYLDKIMVKHPEAPFFEALRRYQTYDPYSLKIIISFVLLVCEKFGEAIIKPMIDEGIPEFIENIKYKFQENQELLKMTDHLLETYLLIEENIDY